MNVSYHISFILCYIKPRAQQAFTFYFDLYFECCFHFIVRMVMDISYTELHMNYLCKICKMYVCVHVWGRNGKCAYF